MLRYGAMKSGPSSLPGFVSTAGPDLRRIFAGIKKDLDQVEKKLRDFSRSSVPLISEVGRYLFQKSGKRIRPALVLLSSRMVGARGPERILVSALVELIHTSSLIHDDIIDNSGLRRGRETVHSKWGPNVTVLLGDHLYIKSIGLSLMSRSARITPILAEVSMHMIEGEVQEYALSGRLGLPEKAYLEIVRKKTAALFSGSCRLGALLGRGGDGAEEALADYGLNLGMCFQVVDDLLDYTGDPAALGKPVLTDLAEGRVTLPLIYALGRDGNAVSSRVKGLLDQPPDGGRAAREIVDIVRSLGGLDYARAKAADYCRRAKVSLDAFAPSAYTKTLGLLADFVLNRDR
jgi:octaprenyl-diphosphate synthase